MAITYLECPDLHWSDAWIETSKANMRAIIKAAREKQVSFVTFPGDLFEKPIFATDKGGINDLQDLMAELLSICPVCAIYGTDSHDAAGCYGPLQRIGLTILQPGKVYGYYGSEAFIVKNIHEISLDNTNRSRAHPDCLLFGIPEVTKDWYQANHPETSADAVNGACVQLVHDLIRNEVTPLRLAYPDIPAIGLLHGNVSDAIDRGAETDIILRSSDIVIKSSVLAEAGLTRWALGHIHTPWESKNCEAGYAGFAGIDRNPWGKTGFCPGMNLVTIDGIKVAQKDRIEYGTPARFKINEPLSVYKPDVAYWLETEDINAIDPAKQGAHPWSRITYKTEKKTERRIDVRGIDETKTICELAKLYDKAITEIQLAKLKEADQNTIKPLVIERIVELSEVEIIGSPLLHGKKAKLSIDTLPTGLVQIVGKNGTGKSSLLGFCTPYPCFIGKDTDSGRQSAIKDFFNAPESGIRKTVYLNGVKHEHVITIRGAHTQTPKTECYLTIDGVPQLEKGTFDQMMETCERLYGSLSEYLMTSFYVQPLQGKFESGLMTANMTTVRDLVQTIAGINHEGEKRYCLDRVNELEKETSEEKIKIKAERETLPSIEELDERRKTIGISLIDAESSIEPITINLESAERAYNTVKLLADRAEEDIKRKASIAERIEETASKINAQKTEIQRLASLPLSIPELTEKLAADDRVKSVYEKAMIDKAIVDKANSDAELEYQKTKQRMSDILSDIDRRKAKAREEFNTVHTEWVKQKTDVIMLDQERSSLTQRIKDINKSCPQCGYVDPETAKSVALLQEQLASLKTLTLEPEPVYVESNFDVERAEYGKLMAIKPPLLQGFELPPKGLSAQEIDGYRTRLQQAQSASSAIQMIQTVILPDLETRLADLQKEHDAISVQPVDISVEKAEVEEHRAKLDEVKSLIATLRTRLESTDVVIETTKKSIQALDERETQLSVKLSDIADWKYLVDILAANHMPAMELDAVLDTIDSEATRIIAPYREGRYMYRSLTQQDGKSSVIDKFDILVHDGETGADKSLLKHSVGEKSFLSDAYVKALIKIRQSRSKTSYNPIISDEADSFIEIPAIPSYYEMQGNYYSDGSRVLIVSHSPDAGNYIQNKVDMTEVLG